jgi:hypothetical protein
MVDEGKSIVIVESVGQEQMEGFVREGGGSFPA